MLERFFLNRRMNDILINTLEIREENQELIREKLAIYKKLAKNFNQELIDNTINIIDQQYAILKTIRDKIISCHLSGFSWSSADKEEKDLMMDGKYLINRLLSAFEQQKKSLGKEAIKDYITYFKEELAAYNDFEKMAGRVPAKMMAKVKKNLEHFHPYDPVEHMKFAVFMIAVYGLMGMKDSSIIKQHFGDLKSSLNTIGIAVGVSFFMSLFSRLLIKSLKRIKKIKKNTNKA